MASAALDITFPGNLSQVEDAATLRLVPFAVSLDNDVFLVSDLGLFTFDASSLADDDGETVIRPAGITPLQAGRWIAAGSTIFGKRIYRASLAALKAAPAQEVSLYNSSIWTWTLGNFTGKADDINIVQANGTPLIVGAWVRQRADGIVFAQPDSNAALRTMLAKGRETRSVEDFFQAGDNDADTIQRAINATGDGSQLVFTRPADYVTTRQLTVGGDGGNYLAMNAHIVAAPGVSFENMVLASGRSRLSFRGFDFNANGPARAGIQNVRYMGLVLTGCFDVDVIDCAARNVRGYESIPAVGLTAGGAGARIRFINPRLYDCGTTGFAADGIFCSSDDSQIIGGTAVRVTDTAFVLESCNNSAIIGGTVRESSVAAAITNATSVTKRGNRIIGLNGYDLVSNVTGWVQIGALGTGNLEDSHCDVKLQSVSSGFGGGPAINIRQPNTGKVNGVRLTGSVYNPSRQAVLVAGKNVHIAMAIQLLNTTEVAINFQPGSTGTVHGSTVLGGKFGLATFDGSFVRSLGTTYDGQNNYNLFAFAPSTIISSDDNLLAAGVGNFGAEPSAICSVFGVLTDGYSYNGLKVGGVRGPAIPNATDASSTQARLNDLLTFLRGQGMIAA